VDGRANANVVASRGGGRWGAALTTRARFSRGVRDGGRRVLGGRHRMECAITRLPGNDDEPSEGSDQQQANTLAGKGELPANSIQLPMPKRRAQLSFTCNKCEARTTRMVNPEVYKKGTMFVQCANCEVWHQLVDNLGLIYDFKDVVLDEK